MKHGKIYVAGIGPGSEEDITPAVRTAIMQSDVVVGYKYYFNFIRSIVRPETVCIDTGMKKEKDRAALAFEYAEQGRTVCVVSSGDAGIYGMAPLVLEMKRDKASDVEVEILPGISAFQKGAALLGAPIGHDFCIISLSDLMTPWEKIERRIIAAASADFVTAIYNPKSEGRYWQLYRLKELFLKHRQPETPVGYIRQAGREEQEIKITTLHDFNPEEIDMFTIVIIGNSQSYTWNDKIITPRGYYREQSTENVGIGQEIMMRSFRTIESELKDKNIPLGRKWALLHAIHTTADFSYADSLVFTHDAAHCALDALRAGATVLTDTNMALAGISKPALEKLGCKAVCYMADPDVAAAARAAGTTRAVASMDKASGIEGPLIVAVGNAPTALLRLAELMDAGKIAPALVVGVPVGFVNVVEAKEELLARHVPAIVARGRKGGSTVAAAIMNALLYQITRPGGQK